MSHSQRSLKNMFSFAWSNNNDSNSPPTRSRKRTEQKEQQSVDSNLFRRKRRKPTDCNTPSIETESQSDHPFVVGLAMNSKLQKMVEQEQITRKLTLEREKKKQSKLQQLKEEKRMFDIALLINKNNEYHKILQGPITYEVFYSYLRFSESQEYIHNDITVLNQSCVFAEQLSGNDIFEYYCQLSPDKPDNLVPFRFTDIEKVQLFRFKENEEEKQLWKHHKETQKHLKFDVLIIANTQNIPKYVLCDVQINLVTQHIQFHSYHTYETGDVGLLDTLAIKELDFEITKTSVFYKTEHSNLFTHNFSKSVYNSFQFALCYNFKSETNKNLFLNQSFDVALVTNENDELLYLLNGIGYNVLTQNISYKHGQYYRNGYYDTLKQCAKEIKHIKVKNIVKSETDDLDLSLAHKCILYTITNNELWNAFIGKQKTTKYDMATITDSNNYLCYVLKQVNVNWVNSCISFNECQDFNSIHNEMIHKYGQLILSNKMSEFTLQNRSEFDDSQLLTNIFFYNLTNNALLAPMSPTPKTPATPQLNESLLFATPMSPEPDTPLTPDLTESNAYNNAYTNHDAMPESNTQMIGNTSTISQHRRKDTPTHGIPTNPSMISAMREEEQGCDSDISADSDGLDVSAHVKTGTTVDMTDRDSIMPDRMSVLQRMGRVNKLKQQMQQSQSSNNQKNKSVSRSANNKKKKMSADLVAVWDGYIHKYGFEPANAEQLKVFSQIQPNVKAMSYFKARQLFNSYASKQ